MKNTGADPAMAADLPKTTISKSIEAIHFTVDPKTEMTLGSAKGFNAVNYLMQVKALNSKLSASAYNELLGDSSVTIKVKCAEFMSLIGSSSRNFAYLKKLVNEIGQMRYTHDNNRLDHGMSFSFVNMFTKGEIHNGEVIFIIPPETRTLLISDKPVAVIDFITLHSKIQSKFGIALNDIIQQQMHGIESESKVFTLNDATLRNALKIKYKTVDGVVKYSYHQPHDFQRKVLQIAVDDYNNAGMEFKVTDFKYEKQLGQIYWTFFVEHYNSVKRKEVIVEFSAEILKASATLTEFKVSDFMRGQIISNISCEFDVHYLLYCIQLTKEKKADTPAAYFIAVYENNKKAFTETWEIRKLEIESEKIKRAEKHLAFIRAQKEEFRKKFYKAYASSVADQFYRTNTFPFNLEEALINHCRSMGRTLKANEILNQIKEKRDIDFASPVFASFYPDWIENNCSDELNTFINNQTLILPD